ncbi:hypothetical protein BC831DRAFT_544500 [Entophlyctis helioformis]|nr:hypothetical protein BC831DRAFT_544500 [Entophlyctis helioformis]
MTKGGKKKGGFGEEDMGMKYGRSDLVRMGLLARHNSRPCFVTDTNIAICCLAATALDYRTKGKQFLTAPPKKGHDTKDSYFDKEYIRLFENEPYTDLVVLRRRWRINAKEKNITGVPFKPSSVPPKPSGKGSHWGTIEQQWPIENKGFQPLPPKKAEDTKKIHEPRNFLTAPPKMGSGYGAISQCTIGKSYIGADDLQTERHENKKRMVGERPFISSSTSREYFNPFAGLSTKEEGAAAALAEGAEAPSKRAVLPSIPFKPSSCCGTTINPYPSYEPPKGGVAADDKSVTGAAGKGSSAPPRRDMIFKPSGVTGSYPVRSIVEVSCPLAPPEWIQESLRGAMMTASI